MKEKWVILHNSDKDKKQLFINKLMNNVGFSNSNITKDMDYGALEFVEKFFKDMRINVKDWKRKSSYMSRGFYGNVIPEIIPNIIGNFYNSIMFIHKEEDHNLEKIDAIYRELIQKNPDSQGLIININRVGWEDYYNIEGINIIKKHSDNVEEQYFKYDELDIVKERFPNMIDQIKYIDYICKIENNQFQLRLFLGFLSQEKENLLKEENEMFKEQQSILLERHCNKNQNR